MQTGKESSLVSKVMVLAFVLCMAVPAGAILGAAPVAGTDTAVETDAAPAHSTLIRLQYATFDTKEVSGPSVQSNLQARELKAHEKGGFLVQPSAGQITEEWKAELQLEGAEILGYIPDNALLVRVKGKDVATVRDLDSVSWMGPFHPAYKISPQLGLKAETEEQVRVAIVLYGTATNGDVVRLLKAYDQEVVDIYHTEECNQVIANVDSSLIDEISSLHDVAWVQVDNPVQLENLDCTQVVQSGTQTGGRPIHAEGIVGEGYIACVCDSNARPTHETVSAPGKIIANYVSPNSRGVLEGAGNDEHGVHVHTTVLGDRSNNLITDGTGDGHAPGAKLIFQDNGDLAEPDYVYPSNDLYNDHFYLAQFGGVDINGDPVPGGAIVHSNSWGGAPGYSAETATIDRYGWDYPNFNICFAAGNDGANGAETLDNQAEAKNVIGVGATDATGASMASFSSLGPTVPDGRIKPDLCAPGMTVTSADGASDTGYVSMQGTSMATPAVGGDVVLVYEYYDRGFYPTGAEITGNGFEPSANLVKATFLAGCVDMGTDTTDIPNFSEGWGRVHLENSLFFAGDTRHIQVYDNTFGVIQGQTVTYNIGVDDNSVPLKVFLVYNDYPGNPASSVMLVNDLDITCMVPGGTTYYGNNFANGASTTGVFDEELNNVRAFHFPTPTVGVYTITITASNVPYGPQPYALVANGGINPGYGTMQINKKTYGAGDYIEMRVEDLNNPAGTITATVTTSVGADSESVTLTATGVNSGVFTGSLMTKVGNIVLNDGRLEVIHGETLTVRYADGNPTHNADATATVDISGPVISDVWFSDTAATSTVVHWTTNENADSKLLYQKEGEMTWNTKYVDDLVIKHDISLTGLEPGEVYYIDISSTDISGVETVDDNGGFHYKITTLSATAGVMVLLVDDDDGTASEVGGCAFEEDWKNNLKAYGWSYTHWDYKMLGTPTLTDMNAHKMVVWVVNEGYPQLDDTDINFIMSYLDQDDRVPRFYIAGQDVGWDLGSGDSSAYNRPTFLSNYFRGTYIIDDASYGTQGVEEDPFQVDDSGHDVNSVHLLTDLDLEVDAYDPPPYDFDRFWPDDMHPVNGGVRAMQYSNVGTSDSAMIAYSGPNYGGGTYNMVYACFAPDMICFNNNGGTDYAPPAVDEERAKLLDEVIIYLLGGDHADINLITPVGGETLTGVKNVQWTVAGNPDWINVFVSSNAGGAWELAAGGNLTGTATNYNLNTALYSDGAKYQIKVVGITQVPGVILTGEDRSANVTFSNGIDTVGPVLAAGTLAISPNPTYGTNGALSATFTDTMFGNSPITQAQYRLDGGTWTNMAISGGSGTPTVSFTATVTCPVASGTHTIEVWAKDDHNNWGPVYDIPWYRYVVTTNPSPDAPTNPSPADDATGVSTNPTLSVTVVDPNAEVMDVEFYNANGDVLIGTDTNVASGGTASVVWSGLTDTTAYSWYAVAYDSEWSTGSEVWSFQTGDFTAPAATADLSVDHFGPAGSLTVTEQNRYLRGVANEATVNGLTAYSLGLTNSATAGNYAPGANVPIYLGMRVYKRSSAGVETEITTALSATVSRTATGSGFQSATWSCPQTALVTTDSIVIKVYGGTAANPTTVRATFTTGQLGATQLDAGTWSVQYWTKVAGNNNGGTDWYWGTDTYANYINGFDWSTYVAGNPLWHNTLNWTHSGVDVDHYNIYRSDVIGGPWDGTTLIDTVPVGTNTYVDMDKGQADTTIWYYVVRAEDASGNEESNTVAIPEPGEIGNLPPVAHAGLDQSGTNPYNCNFDGTGSSDPDGTIVSYSWTFMYNAVLQTLTGATPTFNFAISGSYVVTLTVTDDGTPAAQDTDTMTVTVNAPPIANAGVDQSGYVNFQVTFNGGGSSDADGSIVSYVWTFTYNALPQTRTGLTTTFIFQLPGVYTVTLTVTDDLGATDTDEMIVTASYLTHNLNLAAGWNMVSFAVNTEGGQPLSTVFADEWANIQAVQYYNAQTGDWQVYDADAPNYMNDLKYADETKGYWVKSAAACTLTVSGKALTTSTVQLYAGWNLVGVPDQHSVAANTALVGTGFDLLAKFDAGQVYKINVMAGSELMVPGNAYWVHVPAATSYVVTY